MSDSEPAINGPTDVVSAKLELNALFWEFAEQHPELKPKIARAFALVEQLSPRQRTIPDPIGLIIKIARDRLLLNQKKFSEILDAAQQEISNAETKNKIGRELRRALQRLLGVDILDSGNVSVDALVTAVRAKMEQK